MLSLLPLDNTTTNDDGTATNISDRLNHPGDTFAPSSFRIRIRFALTALGLALSLIVTSRYWSINVGPALYNKLEYRVYILLRN